MLDNLRAMAVFAGVVRHGSFSGAGKEFGITTSAVSQQIRSLETELGVVLLHRSTRKLSLTEAGESLYESAQNIVKSAEEARENVGQLRDGILGSLRIATTPKLAREHILPALSEWLHKHSDLSLHIFSHSDEVDMIGERVDLSIDFAPQTSDVGVPLAKVPQILVASPDYLARNTAINEPKDLLSHSYIGMGSGSHHLAFDKVEEDKNKSASKPKEKDVVRPFARFATNDMNLALSMAQDGYGVVKTNLLDAKPLLDAGVLKQVLSDYELPLLVLHARTLNKEQQPAKVWRCIEVLTEYFAR